MDYVTIKPTFLYKLNSKNFIQCRAGMGNREMIEPALIDEEDRDGTDYSFEISYINSFAQGKGMINLFYSFLKDNTDGSNWERKDNNIGSTFLLPYKKLSFIAGFQKTFKDFSNKNTIFKKKRSDEIFNFNGGINVQLKKNIKFTIMYSYTRNLSNIPIYDYKRNVFSCGIQYTF